MKKIFSILVVLMMVAGTFVSCSKPTDVSTGAEASVKGKVIAESSDGALCIVRDERGEVFFCTKAASVFEGYYSNAGYTSIDTGAESNAPKVFKKLYFGNSELNAEINYSNTDYVLTIRGIGVPSNTIQTITYNGYTFRYKIN